MVQTTTGTEQNVCDAALNALQYYSLFHYPLTAKEIYGNLPVKSSRTCLDAALDELEATKRIYRYEEFYCLERDVKRLVGKRKEANSLAQKKLLQAAKAGRFIALFPFVRFVGISGSLSKGYANAKSDFDFFVVTRDDRLWICRTLLHLFKKLTFLFGQQHKFCMNYFIDLHNLEIEEQNRFTAIELSSLIPVSGHNSYIKLMEANEWVDDFLPNGFAGFNKVPVNIGDNNSIPKRATEFLFDNLFPGKLNTMLMTLTDRKWRRKWTRENFPMDQYDVAFKTTLHVSKNHPANHQQRVLSVISQFSH